MKIIILSAASFCMAFSLSTTFAPPALEEGAGNVSPLIDIFTNIKASARGTSFLSSVLFGMFLWLNGKIAKIKKRRSIALPVVSLAVAVVWLMGESFCLDNTLLAIHETPGQIVKSCLYLVGITCTLTQAGYLFWYWLDRQEKREVLQTTEDVRIPWRMFCRRHSFLCFFVLICLLLLPHIIIAYPGATCYDVWNQLVQTFGISPFSSHHPPMHTLLQGWIIKLGMWFGNGNFGLFLVVLFQTAMLSLTSAYMLHTMYQKKVPAVLLWITLGMVVFVPYFSGYVGVLLKDNVYAYFFVLMVTELYYLLEDMDVFCQKWRHVILFGIGVVGVIWFRNNGKYVVYPMVVVLLMYLFVRNRGKSPGVPYYIRAVSVLLVPVLLAAGVSAAVTRAYDIQSGSIKEALSLPFQQTARYVKEYGDEVTKTEEKSINKVLDYDVLPERYNPRISDPVKNTYRQEASTGDLIHYIKVWGKQFMKHPMVYVKATMNQNYYLLYPKVENDEIYSNTMDGPEASVDSVQAIADIHNIESLQDKKQTLREFYRCMFSIPCVGLFSSLAFYNMVLLFMILFALREKKVSFLLFSIPAVLSNAIIVLAPVIQGHPRYGFPIIYTMPLLTAFYIGVKKYRQEGTQDE